MKRGLTIIEMLVSLASIMLLMMAYVTLFADVSGRIGEARSMIELTNRMRSASQRLRSDLEAHTCDLLPWQRPESGGGYFEIIEGPLHDYRTVDDPSTLVDERTYPIGDTDDVLMFTVRSKDGPFSGKLNGQTVQSEVAEVFWYLSPTMKADGVTKADPATFTLYRRVFLVLPTYQGSPTAMTLTQAADDTKYDISYHPDGTNGAANTLADLCKRECRTWHDAATFPHKRDPAKFIGYPTAHVRYGEDVVLTNVIGFDVQVFDPVAPVRTIGNVAVSPGEPGYASGTNSGAVGSWVDLGWGQLAWPASGAVSDPLSTFGHPKSKLVCSSSTDATFDAWSYHYEHDGIKQNASATNPDEGTDGFDNNGDGVVDDPGERETSPPYPVPLRGVKIRIRCYEPDSRAVHEVDVVESFVPQ